MIYLASDNCEQGVYFDLRKQERRSRGGEFFQGLLGNGVEEMPVTVRTAADGMEIEFGRSRALFEFIDERLVRRALGNALRELCTA